MDDLKLSDVSPGAISDSTHATTMSDLFSLQGNKVQLTELTTSSPSSPPVSAAPQTKNKESIPIPNTTIGGYTRFFSPAESSYFWKKEGGFDIIREGERLGQWECFFEASTGRYFYVNTLTLEVSYTHPEEVIELGTLKRESDAAKWGLLKNVFKDGDPMPGAKSPPKSLEQTSQAPLTNLAPMSIDQGLGRSSVDRRKSYGNMWKTDNAKKSEDEDAEYITERCSMMRDGRLVVPFNPMHHNRLYWDLFVIIPILVYLCVAMPFTMCFAYVPRGGHALFETGLDLIFCCDIIISFLTGILIQDEDEAGEEYIEYDAAIVAKNYILSWFFLDLISALPLNLLIKMKGIENFQYFKLLKSGKALKALRLVRVFKIAKIVKSVRGLGVNMMDETRVDQLEEIFSNNFARSALMLFKITLQITFINHLLCCLWVYVGRQGDYDGINNWLREEGFEYKETERGPYIKKIYITSLYFCCTTMTSVGYGDILPYNANEKIFCIFAQITGGFVYAMIIASLTAVVTFQESNDRIKHEKMGQVVSYINIRRFPRKLGRKIRRHFRELFDAQVAVDETAILNELSADLRIEVSQYLVAEMMEDVMPFKDMSPIQWSIILPLLRPFVYETDQVLCTQGEYCIETFIILEGTLEGKCSAKKLTKILSGENRRDAHRHMRSRVVGMTNRKKSLQVHLSNDTPNIEDEEDVKTRTIQPGETINVLCMLGIWEMAVETVTAIESGDSYLINAEDFLEHFQSHTIFEILRQHTVETMFEMAKDPDAPTKYGIPLWPLTESEVAARDEEFLKRKTKEKEASYRTLTNNMKLKMKAQKAKDVGDDSKLPTFKNTIKTLSSKSVINKLRLKGSNQQITAQQNEDIQKRMKKKARVLSVIRQSNGDWGTGGSGSPTGAESNRAKAFTALFSPKKSLSSRKITPLSSLLSQKDPLKPVKDNSLKLSTQVHESNSPTSDVSWQQDWDFNAQPKNRPTPFPDIGLTTEGNIRAIAELKKAQSSMMSFQMKD